MWVNAQRDGHPAEYRWRPLFNAAKFVGRPLLECRAVTDTTKLSDMVIASFGDGQNLIREGKMFIKDESKVASRVSGVK